MTVARRSARARRPCRATRASAKPHPDAPCRRVGGVAYLQARKGEPPQAAASRALAALADVDKAKFGDEDARVYNDAAMQVGASRWAGRAGEPDRRRPGGRGRRPKVAAHRHCRRSLGRNVRPARGRQERRTPAARTALHLWNGLDGFGEVQPGGQRGCAGSAADGDLARAWIFRKSPNGVDRARAAAGRDRAAPRLRRIRRLGSRRKPHAGRARGARRRQVQAKLPRSCGSLARNRLPHYGGLEHARVPALARCFLEKRHREPALAQRPHDERRAGSKQHHGHGAKQHVRARCGDTREPRRLRCRRTPPAPRPRGDPDRAIEQQPGDRNASDPQRDAGHGGEAQRGAELLLGEPALREIDRRRRPARRRKACW